jgi:hypothetical protein
MSRCRSAIGSDFKHGLLRLDQENIGTVGPVAVDTASSDSPYRSAARWADAIAARSSSSRVAPARGQQARANKIWYSTSDARARPDGSAMPITGFLRASSSCSCARSKRIRQSPPAAFARKSAYPKRVLIVSGDCGSSALLLSTAAMNSVEAASSAGVSPLGSAAEAGNGAALRMTASRAAAGMELIQMRYVGRFFTGPKLQFCEYVSSGCLSSRTRISTHANPKGCVRLDTGSLRMELWWW